MEKKTEATIVYWGYIGIMEKKMEATIAEIVRTCLLVSNVNMWATASGRQAREHKAHHFTGAVSVLSNPCI